MVNCFRIEILWFYFFIMSKKLITGKLLIKKIKILKNDDAKKLYDKITKKACSQVSIIFNKLSKKNIHFENKNKKRKYLEKKDIFRRYN